MDEIERKQYTVRIPESLYIKIEQAARKNKRSINGQIEFMLEENIEQYEKRFNVKDEK